MPVKLPNFGGSRSTAGAGAATASRLKASPLRGGAPRAAECFVTSSKLASEASAPWSPGFPASFSPSGHSGYLYCWNFLRILNHRNKLKHPCYMKGGMGSRSSHRRAATSGKNTGTQPFWLWEASTAQSSMAGPTTAESLAPGWGFYSSTVLWPLRNLPQTL